MKHNPFDTEYDVAIFGGGMCGVGTALTLAAKGRDVLLVARRQALGWEATSAFHCKLEKSDSPAAERIRKRLNAIRGQRGDRVDAPFLEFLLDQLVDEAGIDLLLYSQPTQSIERDGLVRGIVIGNKSGEQVVRARAFVDATEEGLLWRQSQIAWKETIGRPLGYAVFFNSGERGIDLPRRLGDTDETKDITLHPSVREGEVCVEFALQQHTPFTARTATDRLISFVRENVSQLYKASVTHASFEPFPLDAPAVLQEAAICHPRLGNLFGAGIWTIPAEATRKQVNTLAGRIWLGEETARLIANRLAALPPQDPGTVATPTAMPTREADVIVVGGGTSGALAAIAAGRQGASVILLEASTLLGGMVTGGGVSFVGHGVRGGLQDEYHSRVAEKRDLYSGQYRMPPIHPEAAKVVLEEMCRQSGIEVVYGATAIGAEMLGNRIQGVVAATPTGRVTFRGKAIVDSTGDADVARMAGAPTRTGRETDHVIHCYSQCGMILFPNGRMWPTNHDCGYVDSSDIIDLTHARRQGIRQMHARWHRGLLGERRLLYHAPLIGIRQGKLIVGDYEKTMLEQILPVRYKDCIGYASAKYDCHSQDFENQRDLAILWVWMLGNRERGIGGEIPYRCMLPKNVEGLLVACRSASTTNEANYQFRVIRNMLRIGEAAGIAAAYCAERGTTPRDLDVELVQDELYQSGALSDSVRPKQVVPKHPLEDLRAMLASDNPGDAVWLLAQGGPEARSLLKDVVQAGSKNARFWAAIALAWHRDPDALPELVECVSERIAERTDFTPRHRNMVPLWQSSIVMLGRIGDRRAVPALLEILQDRSIDIDATIAAIRALGRIGDAAAVPALLAMLARDDLPRDRKFQQTNIEARWPAGEDGLWQVELAAAEVLAGFGQPQARVVEKYLRDPRSHVRRYASMVQGTDKETIHPQ